MMRLEASIIVNGVVNRNLKSDFVFGIGEVVCLFVCTCSTCSIRVRVHWLLCIEIFKNRACNCMPMSLLFPNKNVYWS